MISYSRWSVHHIRLVTNKRPLLRPGPLLSYPEPPRPGAEGHIKLAETQREEKAQMRSVSTRISQTCFTFSYWRMCLDSLDSPPPGLFLLPCHPTSVSLTHRLGSQNSRLVAIT